MVTNKLFIEKLKKATYIQAPESLRSRFVSELIPSLRRRKLSWWTVLVPIRIAVYLVVGILVLGSSMVVVTARESDPGDLFYGVKVFFETVAPKPMKPLMQKSKPTETPTPIQTATPTPSTTQNQPTQTPTSVPTATVTPNVTPTATVTPSATVAPTPSVSITPTPTTTSDLLDGIQDVQNIIPDVLGGTTATPTPTSTPSQILQLDVSLDIPSVRL